MNKYLTNLIFRCFLDYEDGEIACMETAESEIPVNINAEEQTDLDLEDGEICSVEIFGVSTDIAAFTTEEEYYEADTGMASISMIPIGTFSLNDDEDFIQSPDILFAGRVIEVEYDDSADTDNPNYCITVETLEMTIKVYTHYAGTIDVGYIVKGVAWLYGDIIRAQYRDKEANMDYQMSNLTMGIAEIVDMLPDEDKFIIKEIAKKFVVAWDPDYTKLTPKEAADLEGYENEEFVALETVDELDDDEVEKEDGMTDEELNAFLELIALLIESKATNVKDAAKIVRDAKVKL